MSFIAKLSEEQLRRVRDLEKDLGIVLVAFQKPPVFAKLSKTQISKLENMEKELGTRLVAYK